MKISVITASYNSATTIEDTIKSVLSQNYSDIEYIIIDGGSKDGTLEIINKYKDKISEIVSEPDHGLYDAMNKGIALATGDVIGILNSDDFFAGPDVLSKVANAFTPEIDLCYGNIRYVDRIDTKKKVRFWRAGEYKKEKLDSGWIMPHPAVFVRKNLYDKFGLFNLEFKIAADYELLLRFLKHDIKVKYIDETLVHMREGGFSAINYKRRKAGWEELKKAWVSNGLKLPKFFIIRRLLSKIDQYLFAG